MATKPKAATLAAGLVRKSLIATTTSATATPPATPPQAVQPAQAATPPAGNYYKSMTLKLDKSRYSALKTLGLREDKSGQELLTAALDAYLAAAGMR